MRVFHAKATQGVALKLNIASSVPSYSHSLRLHSLAVRIYAQVSWH
jgi:hypothetical protein